MKQALTHKGWFWLCPIYMTDPAVADGDFAVEARVAWLEWLFTCCEGLERARIWLTSLIRGPEWEPTFMFHVTGPRKTPT